MSKILNLSDEIALIDSPDFELGKYIYLGQVRTEDGATAVVSVAYKANYAARKLKTCRRSSPAQRLCSATFARCVWARPMIAAGSRWIADARLPLQPLTP